MKYLYILISAILTSCGAGTTETGTDEIPVDSKYAPGKAVYDAACVVCHMKDGKGLENTFPPLAGSDYLLNNPSRALQQVVYGSSEKMTVNGIVYSGIMPPQDVTDEEAVEVVNYILNAWGNKGGEVNAKDLEEVKKNKN